MANPVILEVCRKHRITVNDFFSKKRNAKLMACRAEAAQIFRDRGNSWDAVARLLKRNRDTARYWLDDNVRQIRKAYMLKRWREAYKHEARA